MGRAASVLSIHEPGALDFVQSLLERGISVRVRVSGGSMRPLIECGATVEVAPLAGAMPLPGDILLLRSRQGKPLAHRLIWRRRRKGALLLLTKGDACAGFDGFVPAEQALGRVERIIYGQIERSINLRKPCWRLRAGLMAGQAVFRHLLRAVVADAAE